MSKFLITGVSSGIGRALTKKLIAEGNTVWGVARRGYLLKDLKKELKSSPRFIYSIMNVSKREEWGQLIVQMGKVDFIPTVIIFNAAISLPDLVSGLNTKLTREMFDVNFFGIMEGIRNLLKIVKSGTQFMAISSLSALKGSEIEGVGYPASKAALSIAFESLHQKYRDSYIFKTIYLGPVATGMGPFKKRFPFLLSEEQAVETIFNFLNKEQPAVYTPRLFFFLLRLIRLLPPKVYFMVLSKLEDFHLKRC